MLVEQSAIPLPSVPLLLAAGSAHPQPAACTCRPRSRVVLIAALIADTIWFQLGRHRGRRVPAPSVPRFAGARFLRAADRERISEIWDEQLLVSKFIPGLNAVAAPLAGNSRSPYWRFLLYDSAGAVIWSGVYLALGYLFSEQLETMVAYASRMGSNLLLLVVAPVRTVDRPEFYSTPPVS